MTARAAAAASSSSEEAYGGHGELVWSVERRARWLVNGLVKKKAKTEVAAQMERRCTMTSKGAAPVKKAGYGVRRAQARGLFVQES